MKHKGFFLLFALLVCAAFAAGLCGFTLTGPEAEAAVPDRLCGLLVTREPLDLFDVEGYLNDHASTLQDGSAISAQDAAAYSGRLMADADGHFPVEGYCFYRAELEEGEGGPVTTFVSDEVFSGAAPAITVTDDGTDFVFSATLYVCSGSADRAFYCNPIYQAADGSLYALSGSGTLLSGDEVPGVAMTQTLRDEAVWTVNGTSRSSSTELSLRIELVAPPEQVQLLQYDADGALLRRDSFAPEDVPEQLTPEPRAAWIVICQRTASGEQVSLATPEAGSFTTLSPHTDGLCVQRRTELLRN